VFSVVSVGIRRVKRHHSGAVGNVLGNEMGKEFSWPLFPLSRFPQGQAGAGGFPPRGEQRAAPPARGDFKTLR